MVDTCVLVYLNDILIYFATAEDHTRVIFEQFAKSKFYLDRKKCASFLLKVGFFGHIVLGAECRYRQGRCLPFIIGLCYLWFTIQKFS